jgi:hypothetical protein
MSEATVVDARLDKLEQDNRRLKLTVGALLLALAAVPLIGAVMPQEIPDAVRARSFEMIDENGTLRAWMSNIGTTYYDEKGTIRLWIQANGSIVSQDENGTLRALMNQYGIAYFGENGTTRAWMDDRGFRYYDENDNIVWSTECAPNC